MTGGDFAAARERVRGDFVIVPRVTLKSDEPVMLDGMRFDELQKQFDVPLSALDFAGFAEMLGAAPERAEERTHPCVRTAGIPACN